MGTGNVNIEGSFLLLNLTKWPAIILFGNSDKDSQQWRHNTYCAKKKKKKKKRKECYSSLMRLFQHIN